MGLATLRVAMLIAISSSAVAQTPVITKVVSQATFAFPVAPGMPVLVNGTNLASSTPIDCPGPKVPLTCGSVSVTVGGRAVPVRAVYINQVVTYIPFDEPLGATAVVLKNHAGNTSSPFSVGVTQYAPGIQRLSDTSGSTAYGVFTDSSGRVINRSNPAIPGQEVIAYAIGLGPTVPPVPTGEVGAAPVATAPVVTVGGRAATVISAELACGLICDPGNYLVRFRVPADIASSDQQVAIEVGTAKSPAMLMPVGVTPTGPAVGYIQSLLDGRVRAMSPGVMANVVGGGFTDGLGGSGQCAAGPGFLPTKCQGLTVTVNGHTAPLQMVAPTFITIQIPFELSPGPATLVVERTTDTQTSRSAPFTFTLEAFSPTLTSGASTNYAGVLIETSGGPALATNPVMAGDMVSIICAGLGQTNPPMVTGFSLIQPVPTVATPTVTIGGKLLENVTSEALPGSFGQYRVRGRVPSGLAAGELPIVMEIGGKKSQEGLLVPVAIGPMISAVVNGASGGRDIASGSWVSIYGRGLSPATRNWTEADFVYDWMPTTLEGVEVSINNAPAVIAFVSPTQLNIIAPDNLPPGTVDVTVKSSLGWQQAKANVRALAPALFTLPGPPTSRFVLATHTDWSYVVVPGQVAPAIPGRPAKPGEIIALYATGLGPTDPLVSCYHRFAGAAALSGATPARVQIGPIEAEVTYAGMISNGLYQVNVVIPPLADGDYEVTVSMGAEVSAPGRLLPVRK